MMRNPAIVLLTLATALLFDAAVCIPDLYPLQQPGFSQSKKTGLLVQAGRVSVWHATKIPFGRNRPSLGFEFAGFALQRYQVWHKSCSVVVVTVPAWFLLDLLAAYPTIAFVRGPLRRWRHRREGRCVKCGYDLRGSVFGVCSECGNHFER